MRTACDLPPAAETVVTVPRAVEEESRDVFNSNGEVYENACDLPSSSRDCGDSDTGCRGGEQDVLTVMERSMRTLVIYPSSRGLW